MNGWLRENVWQNPLLWHEWRLRHPNRWWRSPLMLALIHIAVAIALTMIAIRMGGGHGGQVALLGIWLALPQLVFWVLTLSRGARREMHWESWEHLRLTLITDAQRSVAFLWSHLFVGWLLTSVGLVLFNLYSGQKLVCIFFLPIPSHVADPFPGVTGGELAAFAPLQVGLRLLVLAWGRRLLQQLAMEKESTLLWLLSTLWFPFLFVAAVASHGSFLGVLSPRTGGTDAMTFLVVVCIVELALIFSFIEEHGKSVKRTAIKLAQR